MMGVHAGEDWDVAGIGDLSGSTAVVTGANSGIGLETTRVIVQHGGEVVMACRDVVRAEAARRDLPGGPGRTRVLPLDLADLKSVAGFADRLAAEADRLELLFCNAAVMGGAFATSAQGYERQMATNHLGHFALTARLWPLLAAAPAARVVTVSSLAARTGRLGPATDRAALVAPQPYRSNQVYSNTKQANLLFAQELHRRARGGVPTVLSVAAHPGVSASNLFPRQLRESGFGLLAPAAERVIPLLMQSPQAGALPLLRAATDPRVPGGGFVGPTGLFGTRGAPHLIDVFASGTDPVAAARVWQLSEELVELPFAV